MKKIFLVVLATLFFISCTNKAHNGSSEGGSNLNSENSNKDITSFSINGLVGIISGTDISVTVPNGTNIVSLTPTMVHTGASINPATGVAQNFTNPVTYTVTASDNSTKTYTITVAIAAAPHVYALRETGPAGGLIFYDKGSSSNGWRYLEAAPIEISAWQTWSNILTTLVGTGTTIGTGRINTDAIISQQGHTTSLAKVCDDLALGGYSDWFMPSIDELSKMYVNLKSGTDENGATYTPVSGFIYRYYSSSSESFGDSEWLQHFYNGEQNAILEKASTIGTRCARAF